MKIFDGKVEPVLLILIFLIVFFTAALFVAEWKFPDDGQMFQAIATALSGVTGAFLMRVKPQGVSTPDTTVTTSRIEQPPNPPITVTKTEEKVDN